LTCTVSGGVITTITVTAIGSGYSYATVTVSGGSGTGGAIQANIAPQGGHGKNIVYELGAYYAIIQCKFQYSESGTISVANDFREIGVIRNPLQYGSSSPFTASTARMTTRLTLASVTGYVIDETVVGGTSGASGTIVEIDTVNKYLYLNNQKKTFSTSETVTGQTSTTVSTCSAINNTGIQKYSGQVLYIEDRGSVQRDSSQQEKFVISIEY